MMIIQIDTENGDYDLTGSVLILTHTPNAINPILCQALLLIGDGAKNLHYAAGSIEIIITVGSQTFQPKKTITKTSGVLRVTSLSDEFMVPANAEVKVYLKSDNGGDSDVDVTCILYDISKIDVGAINESADAAKSLQRVAAVLGNKASQNKKSGNVTIRNYDDDADLYDETYDDDGTNITRTISDS